MAGLGFIAVTLLGIRALSAIDMIAAPVYSVLGPVAIGLAVAALITDRFAPWLSDAVIRGPIPFVRAARERADVS